MVNPQIFRQYDIRGVVGSDLTEETVYLIGKGFGTWLRRHNLKTVSLGGDARLSTPSFKEQFSRGLMETGCDVVDIGIVATPLMYFSIWALKTDAGAMITASHNPSEYNGIKLNNGLASVFGNEIQEILKLIQNEDFESGDGVFLEDESIEQRYIDYIIANIEIERPVKVVVDGGNGMGGPYLPRILKKLGCEVIEIFCDPDGRFPNHHPDPTILKYNQQLIAKVIETNAEVGIGLDGDADRIGVIDEEGNMLYGDQILNIIARDFLKYNQGETVLADVKSSKNLFDDIAACGGVPLMYKTGHANIKNEMRRAGIKVGGEMSGHIFLKDRYLGFDDAIYVSCRFVEIMSRWDMPVSEFLADHPKMFNTPELHINVPEEKKFAIVEKIVNIFKTEGYDVNDIDGVRVTFKDGWGLCRASNTTPVLVLRFEAVTERRMKEIEKLFRDKLAGVLE
ncbi:MAG: phosphomannomutase/phosphoglucomutase [Candidatus Cloacimonetes bacterium]|nr:phosphomannomutase/phosphoglucomutase [Candidatus Cloacimonadota bacterium]